MESIIQQLVGTGISGLMLAFFIWYLNKKDNEHNTERKDWKTTSDEHVKTFTNVVEKNTVALIKMEETLKDTQCKYLQK